MSIVHRIDLDLSPQRIRELEKHLSSDELERASRFVRPRDRARFVTCRGMLRRILGAALDREPGALRFEYGPRGKPELPGRPIRFNVAHTRDLGLVALTRERSVGVDVERIDGRTEIDRLAPRVLSRGELAGWGDLSPAERRRRFFLLWTCKEAYAKATGFGLSLELSSLEVEFGPTGPERIAGHALRMLDCGSRYAAALCTQR